VSLPAVHRSRYHPLSPGLLVGDPTAGASPARL